MDSLKAYLRSEKDKISGIEGNKAKISYILTYYWIWILGIAFFIYMSIFSIHQFFFTVKYNWFYITFANTYAELSEPSSLWKGYVEYTGYDLKEKNVVFEDSCYFDYLQDVTGNTYFETFIALTETGTMDALTMETDSLIAAGQTGLLMDLDNEAFSSIKEKYGDRFIYCKPNDTEYGKDEVAVGIDISDSILMTKYGIYADSCALGIGAHSEHPEAIEAFLDYILE